MEALMMELSAIRGRMKEGIAANARHDALQPRLLTSADDVLVRCGGFKIVFGKIPDLGYRGFVRACACIHCQISIVCLCWGGW